MIENQELHNTVFRRSCREFSYTSRLNHQAPTRYHIFIIEMSLAPATFRKEQEIVREVVARTCNDKDVLGEKASLVILRRAARAPHHEVAAGLRTMPLLLSCTNQTKTGHLSWRFHA